MQCEIDDCTKAVHCRGMCPMHYRRWRIHGSAHTVLASVLPPVMVGIAHPRYRGDGISYLSAHARVRRHRGPASEYRCESCSNSAEEWAYDHNDPDEKCEERERPGRGIRLLSFSPDPAHYVPLCHSCHVKFDIEVSQYASLQELQ